ncbi:hypothetical protein [Nguyenibacter vanlangensis]|uniref:Uncharacterized protein n=1 Tax=Nguyenibacter vanlangensis TaxID=1216886 RepID=A0A7Y7M8T3_9PROT|nr:hypothetical protein [Nguyenibacter vanlangensis]NVN13344.1 hypothetical protein [Nguyenibacter vanlangensis]
MPIHISPSIGLLVACLGGAALAGVLMLVAPHYLRMAQIMGAFYLAAAALAALREAIRPG